MKSENEEESQYQKSYKVLTYEDDPLCPTQILSPVSIKSELESDEETILFSPENIIDPLSYEQNISEENKILNRNSKISKPDQSTLILDSSFNNQNYNPLAGNLDTSEMLSSSYVRPDNKTVEIKTLKLDKKNCDRKKSQILNTLTGNNVTSSDCNSHINNLSKLKRKQYPSYKRKTVVCDICGKSMMSHNIKTHKRSHDQSENKKSHTCEKCGKRFTSKYTLQDHVKVIHSNQLDYVCLVQNCGQKFGLLKKLNNHIKKHEINMKLNDEETNNIHSKQIYTKRHVCINCKKKFRTLNLLHQHNKLFHENRTKFECDVCKKIYLSLDALKAHTTTHTEGIPIHPCDECPKMFTCYSSLYRHKKSKHSNVKEYICKICGQEFALYEGIRVHYQKHNIKYSKAYENGLTDGMTQDIPDFTCEVCGRKFPGLRYNIIYAHMKIHGIKFSSTKLNEIGLKRDHLTINNNLVKISQQLNSLHQQKDAFAMFLSQKFKNNEIESSEK